MASDKPQAQPWSVQIELVEGCNRICGFCGLNDIRTKPGNYKYMTEDTLAAALSGAVDLCPTARFEFAMHGEPLMHKNWKRMITSARLMLGPKPQIMVTTNGKIMAGRMQKVIDDLWGAGVDFIMMDTYHPERLDLQKEAYELTGCRVADFYDELAPSGWSPWANHRRKTRRLVCIMDDLGMRDGEHPSRSVHNHTGGNPQGAVLREPLRKTCTKPFREVTICWDGEVRLCCEDWVGRYVCGNVNSENSLRKIWYGDEFRAARAKLQNKERDFGACQKCDVGSGGRSGLLPRHPPVTQAQEQLVRAVEASTSDRKGLRSG